MITKAGVPSGRVVVGVASYGRSFKMAKAGCDGVSCLLPATTASPTPKGAAAPTRPATSPTPRSARSSRPTGPPASGKPRALICSSTARVPRVGPAFLLATEVDLNKLTDMSRGVGGGNGNNKDDHPTITNRFPKCTKVFTSFGQLKDIADDIPNHCANRYIFALEIHTI